MLFAAGWNVNKLITRPEASVALRWSPNYADLITRRNNAPDCVGRPENVFNKPSFVAYIIGWFNCVAPVKEGINSVVTHYGSIV